MSELSQHAKLIKAIEIAKGAQVGIELSYFDVLEVAGELNEAKEVVAMLNARIAELEAALTNARELIGMTPPPAFPEWIPVKEKLPNLFETVLIWAYCDCDGYDRFDLAFNSGIVWVGTQQDIEYEDVTHWMPLPQPPEVQE